MVPSVEETANKIRIQRGHRIADIGIPLFEVEQETLPLMTQKIVRSETVNDQEMQME